MPKLIQTEEKKQENQSPTSESEAQEDEASCDSKLATDTAPEASLQPTLKSDRTATSSPPTRTSGRTTESSPPVQKSDRTAASSAATQNSGRTSSRSPPTRKSGRTATSSAATQKRDRTALSSPPTQKSGRTAASSAATQKSDRSAASSPPTQKSGQTAASSAATQQSGRSAARSPPTHYRKQRSAAMQAERSEKSKEPDKNPSPQHNSVKIFGATNVRGIGSLINLCRRFGLLRYSDIRHASHKGYKSTKYDSRHYRLTMRTNKAAEDFDTALSHAESHRPEIQKWRHRTFTETSTSRNPFSLLELDEADEIEEVQQCDEIAIACWNINTIKGKEMEAGAFMKRNQIHILAVTETSNKSDDLSVQIPGFLWFGRAKTRHSGGVGFRVDASAIAGSKIEVAKGKTADTLFLRITPPNARSTLLMLVYGKAAAKKEVSKRQWSGHSTLGKRYW